MAHLLVFWSALLVYGALRQDTFYGVDGWQLLRRVASGDTRSYVHLLYKPGLGLFGHAGETLGLTLYDSATWYSAIGAALGVVGFHAAARCLSENRRDALLVTALAAACPAIVFYATVVERHGPFLAYAGFATWIGARLAVRPTPGRAMALGGAVALSYAGHSTGVLLLAWLLPLAAWWPGALRMPDLRRWTRLSAIVLLTTVAGLIAARLAGRLLGQTESNSFAFLAQHAAVHLRQPWLLPVHVWQEWLLAFAPVSVTWLAAWFRPGERGLAAATTLGLAVYLGFSFAILGGFDERGAYLLPMGFAAALLTVRALPTAVSGACVGLAATLAVVQVLRHDDHRHADVAAGIAAAVGEARPYLLLAEASDFELLFVHFPELRPVEDWWDGLDAGGFEPETVSAPGALPALEAFLRSRLDSGRPLVITAAGVAYLEHPRYTEEWRAGPMLLEFLFERFRFERTDVEGFHGFVARR